MPPSLPSWILFLRRVGLLSVLIHTPAIALSKISLSSIKPKPDKHSHVSLWGQQGRTAATFVKQYVSKGHGGRQLSVRCQQVDWFDLNRKQPLGGQKGNLDFSASHLSCKPKCLHSGLPRSCSVWSWDCCQSCQKEDKRDSWASASLMIFFPFPTKTLQRRDNRLKSAFIGTFIYDWFIQTFTKRNETHFVSFSLRR